LKGLYCCGWKSQISHLSRNYSSLWWYSYWKFCWGQMTNVRSHVSAKGRIEPVSIYFWYCSLLW
jgi:hypothetical protein